MNVLTDELIARIASGKDPEALLLLDRHGLPAAPGESAAEFAARLGRLQKARSLLMEELKNPGAIEPLAGMKITRDAAIPKHILQEAWKVTEDLYDIRPDWAPGFFVTERMGWLWGGCSLSDPESGLNLFIIRKNFRKRRRWLVYDRTELLAHELCHAARQALDDWRYEEYFAYRTAHARLRRWFGNCFVHARDAWLFLLPIMLLPVVQVLRGWWIPALPVWPFGVLAALYPAFLLWRNFRVQALARRAMRKLEAAKAPGAAAILFRLTAEEIRDVALENDTAGVLERLMDKDLRGVALRARLKLN